MPQLVVNKSSSSSCLAKEQKDVSPEVLNGERWTDSSLHPIGIDSRAAMAATAMESR